MNNIAKRPGVRAISVSDKLKGNMNVLHSYLDTLENGESYFEPEEYEFKMEVNGRKTLQLIDDLHRKLDKIKENVEEMLEGPDSHRDKLFADVFLSQDDTEK